MIGGRQVLQRRPSYWGHTEYVRASSGLALKKIVMTAGSKSSLEYHVEKAEIYWILEGQLVLRLKDGQKRGAETRITLVAGDCYEIPQGVMHQRIAATHVVILEACSVDKDEDSYIVEDGMN